MRRLRKKYALVASFLFAALIASACTMGETSVTGVNQRGDSIAFWAVYDSITIRSDTTITGRDTAVVNVQDTVLVPVSDGGPAGVDTIFAPGDTVHINRIDTVYTVDTVMANRVDTVNGPDGPVLVDRVDTVFVSDTVVKRVVDTVMTVDTVLVNWGRDTLFIVDTVTTPGVDTIITYDTVVVVDTVDTPPPAIELSRNRVDLKVGQKIWMNARLVDSDGHQVPGSSVEWSSSNYRIARVDQAGGIFGVQVGQVQVHAKADGVSASIWVYVTAADPEPEPEPTPSTGGSTGGPSPSPTGGIAFSDGFESGDLNSATGGRWYNRVRARASTRRARTGNYALEVTFPSGSSTTDSWGEIRGDFSGNAAHEVWLEWYQYIPENYVHRLPTDNVANNKFAIIGHESNMHQGWVHTTRIEVLPSRVSSGISRGRLVYGNPETVFSSRWDLDYANAWPDPVIAKSDRGRWVKYGYHVKNATSIGASNGEFGLWKDGVRIAHNTGVPIAGWSGALPNGYFELTGWANSGYSQTTVFYIDDVKVYTTNPGW